MHNYHHIFCSDLSLLYSSEHYLHTLYNAYFPSWLPFLLAQFSSRQNRPIVLQHNTNMKLLVLVFRAQNPGARILKQARAKVKLWQKEAFLYCYLRFSL